MTDSRHPQQVKALARKNQLLGIVQDQQGITKKELIGLCYTNFGWFPRTTREHIDLLIQFGSLRIEDLSLFTSDYKPRENQTKLTDLPTLAERNPLSSSISGNEDM